MFYFVLARNVVFNIKERTQAEGVHNRVLRKVYGHNGGEGGNSRLERIVMIGTAHHC